MIRARQPPPWQGSGGSGAAAAMVYSMVVATAKLVVACISTVANIIAVSTSLRRNPVIAFTMVDRPLPASHMFGSALPTATRMRRPAITRPRGVQFRQHSCRRRSSSWRRCAITRCDGARRIRHLLPAGSVDSSEPWPLAPPFSGRWSACSAGSSRHPLLRRSEAHVRFWQGVSQQPVPVHQLGWVHGVCLFAAYSRVGGAHHSTWRGGLAQQDMWRSAWASVRRPVDL